MSNYPYDPAFEAWQAEQDRLCHGDFTTGDVDPYGTTCDQLRGHTGPHIGPDPFGADNRISWKGGGTCAGDPIPAYDVHWDFMI